MSRRDPRTGLNERQEAFCRAYALTANATASAREAGYAPPSAHTRGCQLLRQERIRRRVVELRAATIHYGVGGRVTLLAKIEGLFQRAAAAGHYNAALRVLETQARLLGILGPIHHVAGGPVRCVFPNGGADADEVAYEDAYSSLLGYLFTQPVGVPPAPGDKQTPKPPETGAGEGEGAQKD